MGRKTGSRRHIHKYYRLKSNGLWACGLSDCTHYMPDNVKDQVEGRKSICWNCGEEFKLDAQAMEKDRPNCQACDVTMRTGVPIEDIAAYIRNKEREAATKKAEESLVNRRVIDNPVTE